MLILPIQTIFQTLINVYNVQEIVLIVHKKIYLPMLHQLNLLFKVIIMTYSVLIAKKDLYKVMIENSVSHVMIQIFHMIKKKYHQENNVNNVIEISILIKFIVISYNLMLIKLVLYHGSLINILLVAKDVCLIVINVMIMLNALYALLDMILLFKLLIIL